jgi:uncharacterized protein YbaR (Trm112 family)
VTIDVDILCCPACKSRLEEASSDLVCSGCHVRYPIIDGVPVLLHDANSVFSVQQFRERRSTFLPPQSALRKLFWSVLPSLTMNSRAARNYARLGSLLLEQNPRSKVLILGGSIAGEGMGEFLSLKTLEFFETDVAFGPRTKLICDAHDIPFKEGTMDAVVAQAVLEHVADPYRCVREIHRVLRPGGLVYAETPFMQPAHATPYDFQRFTFIGHRLLFREFDDIDFGAVGGPAQALAQAYQHFLLSFSSNRSVRATAYVVGRCTGFWLKYLDYYLVPKPESMLAASGLFFMGRKSNRCLSVREVVGRFKNA